MSKQLPTFHASVDEEKEYLFKHGIFYPEIEKILLMKNETDVGFHLSFS